MIQGFENTATLLKSTISEQSRFYSKTGVLDDNIVAGAQGVTDYNLKAKKVLKIREYSEETIQKNTYQLREKTVSSETERVKISGLLDVVHAVNSSGTSKVFLTVKLLIIA